jgi:hypothetical protein
MEKLKAGDGPFNGTNDEIIREVFDKDVQLKKHGVYQIKENKCATFIYLDNKRHGKWKNTPINNNTEFIRKCNTENLKRCFTEPNIEYAVFKKTGSTTCYFYGIFKFKEEREDYFKCVYERKNDELIFEEWK